MSPSDHLEEIKRQRALLAEQLAKLEREEAAARLAAPTPEAPTRPPASPRPANPDEVLRQFADASADPADVKRGCVTAFAWTLGLAVAALGAIYVFFYR